MLKVLESPPSNFFDHVLANASPSAAAQSGEMFLLNYDPRFAIQFLRRNEVAVKLANHS